MPRQRKIVKAGALPFKSRSRRSSKKGGSTCLASLLMPSGVNAFLATGSLLAAVK